MSSTLKYRFSLNRSITRKPLKTSKTYWTGFCIKADLDIEGTEFNFDPLLGMIIVYWLQPPPPSLLLALLIFLQLDAHMCRSQQGFDIIER